MPTLIIGVYQSTIKVAPIGKNRSLVARASKCVWAISLKSSMIYIGIKIDDFNGISY